MIIIHVCFVGSVGVTVKSKQPKSNIANTSPSKESTQIPLFNANAATILSELGLSEEEAHSAPKCTVRPANKPFLGVPKAFNPGKASSVVVCYMCTYIH